MVPSITKKAKLLFLRHLDIIENEFEQPVSVPEFICKHNLIDADIKRTNIRTKKISCRFLVLDIVLYIFFLALFGITRYEFIHENGPLIENKAFTVLRIFGSLVLEVLITAILTFSAICITRALRTSTRKRPNLCLLGWHIINLLVLATFLIIGAIYYFKWTNTGVDFQHLNEYFRVWYQYLIV